MKLWPYIRDQGWIKDIFEKRIDQEVWENNFQDVFDEKINSWAFRWTFACWMQSGLTILPNVNLVSNQGFHKTATHTREGNKLASLPTESVDFPLKHPPFLIRDNEADMFTQKNVFTPGRLARLRKMLTEFLNK